MILYHGTTSDRVPNILKYGITPANKETAQQWEHHLKPMRGFVYLSECLPWYFASLSLSKSNNKSDKLRACVIKVEINSTDNLYPDEDTIALALAQQEGVSIGDKCFPAFQNIAKKTIRRYKDNWEQCLRVSGLVAHFGAIRVSQIKEVCYCNSKDFLYVLSDTSIKPESYMIHKEGFKEAVEFSFGQRELFYGVLGEALQSEVIAQMSHVSPQILDSIQPIQRQADMFEIVKLKDVAA